MQNNAPEYILAVGIIFILLLGVVDIGMAQERDTTKTERPIRSRPLLFEMEGHSERSVNNIPLPSSGVYKVPEETKYYKPPFMGQHYLDMAVEAYREEQRDKLGLNKLFRFMNMLAPYVYNQFEFGVYQIENLPIVDRDNPLLKPDQ